MNGRNRDRDAGFKGLGGGFKGLEEDLGGSKDSQDLRLELDSRARKWIKGGSKDGERLTCRTEG